MNLNLTFARKSSLRALDIALIGIVASAIALSGYGLADAWLLKNREVEARKEVQERTQLVAVAERDIEKAQGIDAQSVPKGVRAIVPFQSALQEIVLRWDCSLAEFKSSSQVLPYLSRYAKDTSQTGWVQIDVVATIRGPAPNVMGVLEELAEKGSPHEFSSIELKRMSVGKGGTAEVAALLQLRIVTEPEGAQP